MRPWEIAAGTRAFEQQEFVYPRTISVYRLGAEPSGPSGLGAQPYQEAQARGGTLIWASSPLFTGIACSIQEETRGQMSNVGLPGSQLVPFFRIYIPFSGLAKGSLLVHDYVRDEIGGKYEISDPYWDSLGYRLMCILLEA